jgi:hypothetical protein
MKKKISACRAGAEGEGEMSSKERSTDPGLSPSQRKTHRSREAEEAIAEYGDHQTALHSNMERLRAERLKRETEAGPVLYPAEGISDDTPFERVQFSTGIRNALTGAGVTTMVRSVRRRMQRC